MLGRTFCPLGDAAAMPIISMTKKFREEFEAHLEGSPCPYEPAGAHATTAGLGWPLINEYRLQHKPQRARSAYRTVREERERCLDVMTSVPESACGSKTERRMLVDSADRRTRRGGRARDVPGDRVGGGENHSPNYSKSTRSSSPAEQIGRIKRQAPAPIRPKGRWQTFAECAAMLSTIALLRTVEFVRSAENCGVSWWASAARRTRWPPDGPCYGRPPERHALQIEEIKASEAYLAASLDSDSDL